LPQFILDPNGTLYFVVFYFEDVHKLDSKLANHAFKFFPKPQINLRLKVG
jgi:hypothetical protein